MLTAWCQREMQCCGLDGGTFDVAACVTYYLDPAQHLALSQLPLLDLASTGNTFNPSSAKICLNAIAGLDCSSNSSTTLYLLQGYCDGAYTGNIDAGGSGCLSSFDCPTDYYCSPVDITWGGGIYDPVPEPPDGGGVCSAVGAVGSACNDWEESTDCTYLGASPPQGYCDFVDYPSGPSYQCATPKDTGANCGDQASPQECATGLCVPSDAGCSGGSGSSCDGGTWTLNWTCGTSYPFVLDSEGVSVCSQPWKH